MDHTWQPVKEYINDKLKIKDDDKEYPIYYDEYHSEDPLTIIETQTKITNYMKLQKTTKMFNVLISAFVDLSVQIETPALLLRVHPT